MYIAQLISLHEIMGLVAQDTELFSGTIADNIAYGLIAPDESDIIDAAKQANAHEFISSFEDGYKTRVGERGVRLSGGQKQRIAIARVLIRKPKLLFLDEATSALDTENEALVQEALDTLISKSKCTVVLVAHRLSTVINADVIAVVKDGNFVEVGNHETLLERKGVYAKLVARQIKRSKNKIESDGGAEEKAIDLTIDSLLAEDGDGFVHHSSPMERNGKRFKGGKSKNKNGKGKPDSVRGMKRR